MLGSGSRGSAALAAVWLAAAAGSARAAPIVSVDTDPGTSGIQSVLTVSPGSAFEIDVVVEGVEAPDVLTGYLFDLVFDTGLLTLGEVRDGGFLPDSLFVFDVTSDAAGLHVWVAIRSFGHGAVGDGVLLHVGLEAEHPGESSLALEEVVLTRPFSAIIGPIPLGGINGGAVMIVPEPATGLLLGLGCAVLALARRPATCR